MPTAKFEADFSSFLTAVNAANLKLNDFGRGADTVEKQLNDLTDKFSGRALIQEASLMTIAVEKLGGVAKLTGDELTQVGNKSAAAVEKMKALGYEVPAGLQKLADATKANTSATSEWAGALSTMQGVLGAFGIQASIGGVIAFGQAVFEAGDKIQKMSDQTGISAENIQRLQYIAGQTGSSIESLISASQTLEQRIGASDQALQKAFAELGLSFEQIRALDPYTAFTEVADAIGGVADPTKQAALAAEIFGKNWKEILPAIKAGMRETGEQAATMSDETVAALDAMGDAWDALKQKMLVAGGTAIIWGQQTLEAIALVKGKLDLITPPNWGFALGALGTSIISEWWDPLQKVLDVNNNLAQASLQLHPKIAAGLEPVKISLEEEAKIIDQLSKGPIADIKKADAEWAALLDRLNLGLTSQQAALDSVDGTVVEAVKMYLDLGRSTSDLTKLYGLNAAQMEAITRARKADLEAAAAQKKAIDQEVKDIEAAVSTIEKKRTEYNDLIRKQTEDATTFQIENIWRAADEEIKAYTRRYGASAEYADLVYSLAAEQARVVAEGYDKQAAAAEAAAQRSINAALLTAAAWEKAALAGQIEGVTIVGHRPGEPGSELATSGPRPPGPAGPSGGIGMGGANDARINSLLAQGYTYGEAAAIAGGYGSSIVQPTQSRGFSGGVSTTININGSVLGNKDEIARVVGDSLVDVLKRNGYTLPGR